MLCGGHAAKAMVFCPCCVGSIQRAYLIWPGDSEPTLLFIAVLLCSSTIIAILSDLPLEEQATETRKICYYIISFSYIPFEALQPRSLRVFVCCVCVLCMSIYDYLTLFSAVSCLWGFPDFLLIQWENSSSYPIIFSFLGMHFSRWHHPSPSLSTPLYVLLLFIVPW